MTGHVRLSVRKFLQDYAGYETDILYLPRVNILFKQPSKEIYLTILLDQSQFLADLGLDICGRKVLIARPGIGFSNVWDLITRDS